MSDGRAERVEEIKRGGKDYAGEDVLSIYAYNPPEYAIYRTPRRLMVQFADPDSPVSAKAQRAAISVLAPLRGQINGLIDGWRGDLDSEGRWSTNAKRAERYDRRVADALLMVLEDMTQTTTAIGLLTQIKDDIVAERQSLARMGYLPFALAVTVGFVLLMWLVSSEWVFKLIFRLGPDYQAIWTGVSGGAIGALFSIASAIKQRTVLVDLRQGANRADASLRVIIGAISGGMLICLLMSKLIANPLFTQENKLWAHHEPSSTVLIFVLGFIAGFAERLLPDLLERAQLGLEQKEAVPAQPAPPDPGQASAASTIAAASVQAGTNQPPTPPPPEPRDTEHAEDGDLAPSALQVDDPDADEASEEPLEDEENAPSSQVV
jgi:hypothetical protein